MKGLDISMTVIDSHQHFWDPVELELPTLPPEAAVLDRAFMPKDLEPELRKAKVNRTILVQGYPQTHEANRWFFDRADEAGFVAGVVAWVDLLHPDAAADQLDELEAEPKFVGIRHIVENEPDVNWIIQDNVLESLRELARRGIPYDMLAKPCHLRNVLKILDSIGDLRIVIDHIAKPDIAAGNSSEWAGALGEIAKNPNVYCKLSGMVTEADWKAWKPADLKPYVEQVIGMFGLDRVMYGSDWPVCLLAADYQQVWTAINDVLSGLNSDEYARVFGANAASFYGLE